MKQYSTCWNEGCQVHCVGRFNIELILYSERRYARAVWDRCCL